MEVHFERYEIETTVEHNVTMARLLKAGDGDFYVLTVGAARRHPEDSHDPETARLLAEGRALRKLAKAYLRQAQGRIKHADDIKADQERRADEDEAPFEVIQAMDVPPEAGNVWKFPRGKTHMEGEPRWAGGSVHWTLCGKQIPGASIYVDTEVDCGNCSRIIRLDSWEITP